METTAVAGVKGNLINSNGKKTGTIQQNDNTFISLQGDSLDRVQFTRPIRVVDNGGSNQADFVESTNSNFIQFRLGQHISAFGVGAIKNTLYLNYFSKGDVYLGTTLDTTPDPAPTITIIMFHIQTTRQYRKLTLLFRLGTPGLTSQARARLLHTPV